MSEAVGAEIEVCGLKVTITVAGANNVLTADDRELAVFGIIRACLGELADLAADPDAVVRRATAHLNGDHPPGATFACEKCERTFTSHQGLATHAASHRRREAPRLERLTPDEQARRVSQAAQADAKRATAEREAADRAKRFAAQLRAEHEEWLSRRKPTEFVLVCEDCGAEHEASNAGALILSQHVEREHRRRMTRPERTPKAPATT